MAPSVCLLCAVLLAADPPASPVGDPADAAEVAEEPTGGVGVSPVELIPRLEFRQAYLNFVGGVSSHDTTAEIDIQFLSRLLLRYQAPFRLMETPNGEISGRGDLELQALGTVGWGPRWVVAVVVGTVLDTATKPQLGAGKQQVSLGGGAALKPRRWLLGYATVQEQLSVGGQSARQDINQLEGRLGVILFGKRYNWLKLDFDTIFDFEDGVGRLFGTFEVGSLLIGRVGLFQRTGTQLVGQRQLDYSVAGGVRYLFRL